MTEKNYYPLDDTHNVLALLRQGYSFIEPGKEIVYKRQDAGEAIDAVFMEAIPHSEQFTDRELILLSQFLKSPAGQSYGVDSRYFNN